MPKQGKMEGRGSRNHASFLIIEKEKISEDILVIMKNGLVSITEPVPQILINDYILG